MTLDVIYLFPQLYTNTDLDLKRSFKRRKMIIRKQEMVSNTFNNVTYKSYILITL